MMAKASCRGVELLPLHRTDQEAFVVHANAVLTPRGRLMLARRVVGEGWPIARAAEHFHVSWPTAKRWQAATRRWAPPGCATAPAGLTTAPTEHRLRSCGALSICAGGTDYLPWLSPRGCRFPHPRCTRYWCVAGLTDSLIWTSAPVRSSAATSTTCQAH